MKRDGFQRDSGGVFTCKRCGHKTRRTAMYGFDPTLPYCNPCIELAAYENSYLDGEMTLEELAAVRSQFEKKYGRKLPVDSLDT